MITNKTNNFASSQTQNSQSINVQKSIYQIQKYYILLFYSKTIRKNPLNNI